MKHIYQQNNVNHPTIVLLHGTGGNDKDLIPLAQMIDEEASYIGVLGEIREHGMPRFFKRLADGVFDEEDLEYQTDRLHVFLSDFFKENNIDNDRVVLLGYSNGANMAQSLMLHHPKTYRYVMMHHPMNVKKELAFEKDELAHVFIGAGLYDQLCPKQESDFLNKRLLDANISVTLHFEPVNHQLTQSELDAAKVWYQETLL